MPKKKLQLIFIDYEKAYLHLYLLGNWERISKPLTSFLYHSLGEYLQI